MPHGLPARKGTGRPVRLDRHPVREASGPCLCFRATRGGRGGSRRNEDAALLVPMARRIADGSRGNAGDPSCVRGAPVGSTRGGLPVIGRVPGRDRASGGMDFGGNGIAFAMIAARIARAALGGRPDPDAAPSAFRRMAVQRPRWPAKAWKIRR